MMRRSRHIILVIPVLLGLLCPSLPVLAQMGPELVEDSSNIGQESQNFVTRIRNYINEVATKKAQLEEFIHHNAVVENLRKGYNKVMLYATAMEEFLYLTESLYRTIEYDVDYIQHNLDIGLLTPAKASKMMTNLENTIDAIYREIDFIYEVVIPDDKQLTGAEKKKLLDEALAKAQLEMEDLEIEMEEIAIEEAWAEVLEDVTDGLQTGFFGKADAATKAAVEKQVEKGFNNQVNKGFSFPTLTGGEGLRNLALILMGIVIMAYVPYNIYKYNKGERQAKDALLKIFIAMVFGPLLVLLFGILFKV